MIVVYMVILCFSAMLAAGAGMRIARRLAPMLGMQPGAGWCVLIPAVAFLIVVGTPAPVLVGTLLIALGLSFFGARYSELIVTTLLTGAAVLIGMSGLHATTAPYLTPLPPLAAYVGAGVLWLVMGFNARFMSASAPIFAGGALAALVAIATSPLLVSTTQPLMFDALIVASAFAGLLLAGGTTLQMGFASRLGLGFLIAYLQVDAIWQGAWVSGLASIAIWAGVIGWSWLQQESWGVRHGT